jgi:hypothetical protein
MCRRASDNQRERWPRNARIVHSLHLNSLDAILSQFGPSKKFPICLPISEKFRVVILG